jgi:hypothetical protein
MWLAVTAFVLLRLKRFGNAEISAALSLTFELSFSIVKDTGLVFQKTDTLTLSHSFSYSLSWPCILLLVFVLLLGLTWQDWMLSPSTNTPLQALPEYSETLGSLG